MIKNINLVLTIELIKFLNLNQEFPLIKKKKNKNYLTPKISLRFNPSDMKNYSSQNRNINANNIF